MHAAPHIDISAAEQVSLHDSTVPPELSPTGSDPTSNASSPSSSVPVTPLDAPPFAVPPDPLVYGKHQPAPRPFRPTIKSASRGTVGRARQALLSLGKWKRQASSDTGISTGVQLLADFDEPEVSDSSSPSEVEPPPSQSLFSLPNIPIDSTPCLAQGPSPVVRSPTKRSTHDTLPSAPASPSSLICTASAQGITVPPAPPGAPWAPPSITASRPLALASRVLFFLPWCVAVGAAIALYPRALSPLVRAYAGPPRSPLHRLAHHAHTARAHLGIFIGAVCLGAAALPHWPLRAALVGAVVVRAAVVWRGFGERVEEEEEEERRAKEGAGVGVGVEGVEEWREDARCVWRVLCGEEEKEILRACGGKCTVKEE